MIRAANSPAKLAANPHAAVASDQTAMPAEITPGRDVRSDRPATGMPSVA
jgi:hypothetical protein